MLYNWHIIGHEKQLTNLEGELRESKPAHAYLFHGPESVGKFSVARTFAGILQCEHNFCHHCPTCIQIQKGYHPDTFELDDDGSSIKIETIREIIGKLNLSTNSSHKILLVKNIERLTQEAANCLLKTLEEPPLKTIFLLTSSSIGFVKTTIISRVRLHRFQLVRRDLLLNELQKKFPKFPGAAMKKVINFSLGKPGKAITLLNDNELLQLYENIYNNFETALQNPNLTRRFADIEAFCKDEKKVSLYLDLLLHFTRNLMIKSVEKPEMGLSVGKTPQALVSLLKEIENTKQYILKNVNTRLALENLVLKNEF